jgi:two-component system chemotaxis response regulator CheY
MPPLTACAHERLIGCGRRDKSGERLKLFRALPIRKGMATEASENQLQPTATAAECLTAKVLVLDDDASFRALARAILEPAGFEVLESENVPHCFTQLREQAVDAVILDMVMPDRDGFEALREMKELFPEIRVVAVSGASESALYLTVSAHLGADASLDKAKIGALGPLLHVVLDR